MREAAVERKQGLTDEHTTERWKRIRASQDLQYMGAL